MHASGRFRATSFGLASAIGLTTLAACGGISPRSSATSPPTPETTASALSTPSPTVLVRSTPAGAIDVWPTWSPDGKTIAFSSTRDDCSRSSAPDCLSTGDIGPYYTLYLMGPDGSDQRRVSTLFAQIADWSPDGRYLVFEGRAGLAVVSADGSAAGRIPVAVTEPGFPDWIP
ncbi:MAG: hypothetical protein M3P18_18070 [Actinomycetota bacterium]|nr:hypothetical protein [Actinomycetota bacterium]